MGVHRCSNSAKRSRAAWHTKADSTLRSSQAVPHPSTNRALRRLTSEVERDPVHSTRYGRQQKCMQKCSCLASNSGMLMAGGLLGLVQFPVLAKFFRQTSPRLNVRPLPQNLAETFGRSRGTKQTFQMSPKHLECLFALFGVSFSGLGITRAAGELRGEKNCLHFSICACHPCAGAMLIFSVSFQF